MYATHRYMTACSLASTMIYNHILVTCNTQLDYFYKLLMYLQYMNQVKMKKIYICVIPLHRQILLVMVGLLDHAVFFQACPNGVKLTKIYRYG